MVWLGSSSDCNCDNGRVGCSNDDNCDNDRDFDDCENLVITMTATYCDLRE